MIKSERDIYQVLEEVLKSSDHTLTCNDIWDMDGRVRDLEQEGGPNAISNYLGFMWRKGIVIRYPAPRTSTSFARYAYSWKREEEKPPIAIQAPSAPIWSKTNLQIKETRDGVQIDIANVSITIKTR